MNHLNQRKGEFAFLVSLMVLMASCATHQRGGLLSYEEYIRHHYYDPYIIQVHTDQGSLIYVGADHSVDPQHPQVALIEKLWRDFKPTICYSEGGVWELGISIEDAVTRFGEGGLIRFQADRDSVPIYSLEPKSEEELALAYRYFTPLQIKLYYVLRQIAQYNRMQQTDSLSKQAVECMTSFSRVSGLESPPYTLVELENLTAAMLPSLGGWQNATTKWFSPVGSLAWTNHVAQRISHFRDEHMVDLLTHEVKNGQRVFAVVGFSHVIMQEPALKANLKE